MDRIRPSPAVLIEHGSVWLALAWWALPLTHGTGGREPWLLSIGLVLLVPAFLATRTWQRAPAAALALGVAVPLAALGVCVFSATGWRGANDAASYAYAALLVPVLLAYLRTPSRRLAVAGFVCLAGLEQFSRSFLPWWGSGNPAHPMVGTFYWHNQYAAFLVPGALLSLAAVVSRTRPVAMVGWVAAPLCAAGVVFSTSRASMAVLAIGWVLLAVTTPLVVRDRWQAGLRALAVTGATAVVLLVLPGPPLFAHSASPLAGAADRASSGQTLASNGGYRLDFWREAIAVAEHHPLAGGGFHSLVPASMGLVPADWPRSPLAHNGYLQAASDGGALLAVPFWTACALVGAGLLRRLRYFSRLAEAERWLGLAAPVAGLALLAHSLVDFDWSYPALFAMTAVVSALGLSLAPARSAVLDGPLMQRQSGGSTRRWRIATGALALAVLAVCAGLSTHGGLQLSVFAAAAR